MILSSCLLLVFLGSFILVIFSAFDSLCQHVLIYDGIIVFHWYFYRLDSFRGCNILFLWFSSFGCYLLMIESLLCSNILSSWLIIFILIFSVIDSLDLQAFWLHWIIYSKVLFLSTWFSKQRWYSSLMDRLESLLLFSDGSFIGYEYI